MKTSNCYYGDCAATAHLIVTVVDLCPTTQFLPPVPQLTNIQTSVLLQDQLGRALPVT